jgi:hypothetical protein
MERIGQARSKNSVDRNIDSCPDWRGLLSLTGRSTSSINGAPWIATQAVQRYGSP